MGRLMSSVHLGEIHEASNNGENTNHVVRLSFARTSFIGGGIVRKRRWGYRRSGSCTARSVASRGVNLHIDLRLRIRPVRDSTRRSRIHNGSASPRREELLMGRAWHDD